MITVSMCHYAKKIIFFKRKTSIFIFDFSVHPSEVQFPVETVVPSPKSEIHILDQQA